MKKTKLILIVLLFVTSRLVIAQEKIKFDVTVAGFSIGEMEAIKTVKGEETYYDISSEVGFWFFGKVNVEYSINSHFKGTQLIDAKAKTKSNKGDFASDIQWIKDKYVIEATSYKYEKDTVVNHPLHYSSAMLYFEEPTNHKLFMAENYGLPSTIVKKKDHYEVNVNGNRNKFYYVNGKFDKAIMESPIKNYVIKRK
ncbi:hypothetical protein MM236_02585 [Belliella sp. DSM 107340]|uniref:DUF3108 domain-containing protein n=1 Tax=Belliella calami TaxID=2923436 RepID=A0ABS9UJR2_9BACT|nr:DUF6134 family protein [Belliella calami]MCH7396851.1 hypothetical protein [Belliella calami]